MRFPWSTDRYDTRVLRYDPHVVVVPADPYEALDKLYRYRVACNERRRLEAKREADVVSIFHKRQAE